MKSCWPRMFIWNLVLWMRCNCFSGFPSCQDDTWDVEKYIKRFGKNGFPTSLLQNHLHKEAYLFILSTVQKMYFMSSRDLSSNFTLIRISSSTRLNSLFVIVNVISTILCNNYIISQVLNLTMFQHLYKWNWRYVFGVNSIHFNGFTSIGGPHRSVWETPWESPDAFLVIVMVLKTGRYLAEISILG